MRLRRPILLAKQLSLVSLLIGSLPAIAPVQTALSQQDVTQSRDPIPENAPGVTFILRLKDGKTTFRQGELITVEMLFASSLPNTYRVDGRTYDRSGRLYADTYHFEPELGTTDPLQDYVQSGMFGGGMGGLAPVPPILVEKPYVIAQDLNEFVRFDRPGKYCLWVTNSRIAKVDPASRFRSKGQFTATSSAIELEILPADSGWQKQKIQEAKAILDGAGTTDRRPACRVLRFLNSAESETEMIRRYRGNTDGCDSEFHFGLLSSRRREFVIHEMEAEMAAPDHPVTGSYIHTLATLNYLAQYGSPMLPYPAGNEEKMKEWQLEMQNRRSAFQEIAAQYSRQLAMTVSRKEGSALAVTLETLLESEVNIPAEKRTPASAARAAQIAAALPGVFLDLPSNKQYTLLSWFWKPIATPAMLPPLRRLIDAPHSPRDGTFSDVRGLALQRLFELAPEEGRATVLKEIQRTPLRIRPKTLSILPDETLPELDEILSERLTRHDPESEFEVVADYSALIARYATSASLPRVKKAIGNKVGTMACHIQSPLVAFFLRVDPDYGAEVLEQSLAARKETGCYKSEFSAVAPLYWSAKLEGIATAHLDDPEIEVAVQAAAVLGQYGSAAAEQALMDRLERWHTQWNGREKEIQPQLENGIVSGEPAQFETELVRALVRARSWIADPEKMNRIRQFCLTPAGRNEVDAALRDSTEHSIRITFRSTDDSVDGISVGQYRPESVKNLKEKLLQFSKGTTFTWKSVNGGGVGEEQLFRDLKAFLNQHDMKLEKPGK
jgi:hypothetical protein